MSTDNLVDVLGAASFFETYYEQIYRYLQSMVHNSAEAEELAQETFLRAFRQRESLQEPGALVAWLYRIATHAALDRLRQRTRRALLESDVEVSEVELPDRNTPSLEQSVEQEEMSACVQKYVAELTDPYRAVLLLHDSENLTGSEIAELLDLPLATVKMRLHRARGRLQARLRAGCDLSFDERNVFVCESK